MDAEERKRVESFFWEKVKIGKRSECWEWLGSIRVEGYGEIRIKGRTKRAHRVAWELMKGEEIKEGYQLHHRCRNRLCVNPWHLELLSAKQHTKRELAELYERDPRLAEVRAGVQAARERLWREREGMNGAGARAERERRKRGRMRDKGRRRYAMKRKELQAKAREYYWRNRAVCLERNRQAYRRKQEQAVNRDQLDFFGRKN